MQRTRVRAVALPLVAGWGLAEDAGEQQIPCGNDKQERQQQKQQQQQIPFGNDRQKGNSKAAADAVVLLTTDC